MNHLKLFVLEPLLSGAISWAAVTGAITQTDLDPTLFEKGGAMVLLGIVIWFLMNKLWGAQERANEHLETLGTVTKELVGAVGDLKEVVTANKCRSKE